MTFDPVSAIFQVGGKLIDKLLPDPAAKAQALLDLEKLKQDGQLAILASETQLAQMQADVNKIDAASSDKFSSRWRPFIGWVCGVAFAYHFIIQPLLVFGSAAYGHKIDLPAFDMDALNTVLLGMLGLGTMRSFERFKGVSR